ncbi:MAG: ATP-dependent helicase HrpB [Ignavibacteriales bacterium]|nr:ATP-dependent helicase HrpB [Ignavibacteriales bacterium]
MNSLPIDIILPELRSALADHRNVILSADPGAGKTTRVPPALLDESWLNDQKIIMLEPRRLAAIRAAEYMAQQLNEKAGSTIGYRIRGENKIGTRTRIEVVTEGVLTRMLQDDPSLPNVGIVIFDEFHERSLNADLGLALTLDVQEQIRNDLRILVMSATLDGVAIASLLDQAPVIKSEGRMFPVETIYLPLPKNGPIEPVVVSTITKALRDQEGDILVFLPGQREIRRTESLLSEKDLSSNVEIHLLFGEASPEKQKASLQPAVAGKRKIILSTSIAETSLTIAGVRVVIDSGLVRRSSFDPRRGMSGLVTTAVSCASADQRSGRAGRQQPGVCYRLWTQAEHVLLQRYSRPEILDADLSTFVLELTQWGDPSGSNLKFLDPPPQKHLEHARALLKNLNAIDEKGKMTPHGTALARFGIHPRLAHMLIRGKELGVGILACDIAALLESRDLLRGKSDSDIDLFTRYSALKEGKSSDTYALQRIREQSARLLKSMNEPPATNLERNQVHNQIGKLVALAYPERVAKRREQNGKYQLSGNTVGVLPQHSALVREEYLAVAEVDGAGNEVKIFLAAPITKEDIVEIFSQQIETKEEIFWDTKLEGIVARSVTRLGSIELSQQPFEPTPEKVMPMVCNAIRTLGLQSLPWDKESESLRRRSEWLRTQKIVADDWIDLSDERMLSTLEEWLGPSLHGIKKRSQLQKLDMAGIIGSLFTFDQRKKLDRLAPTHLIVPTGSQIPIDYTNPQPILAVRLQEMFGETKTPTVAGGKVKVLLHLLSPARRPLAVTQDLPSFWNNAYQDVRKDMRGEYPKHYWPENPLVAEPTKRTKKYMK